VSGLWGGRFEGGLDPLFEAFNASLPDDRRLLIDDLEGSRAWARALGAAGVLSAEEVERLHAALDEIGAELGNKIESIAADAAEDVHSLVEAELVRRLGELGKKLHTGRSRNDQVATDLKLHLKRRLPALDEALEGLVRALAELAREHADLPMPGYTHLQRAQPITVGHHALAYVEMLARDRSRLADALSRLDTCPLGSGALAGSAWPVDREAIARELGFAGGPTRNSLDAVSDRDHALDLAFTASLVMIHLSRFAEDWIFFASREAGFLELSDAVSSGSSLRRQ
jgi:argininosuccinate lyase